MLFRDCQSFIKESYLLTYLLLYRSLDSFTTSDAFAHGAFTGVITVIAIIFIIIATLRCIVALLEISGIDGQ